MRHIVDTPSSKQVHAEKLLFEKLLKAYLAKNIQYINTQIPASSPIL